MLFNLFKIKKGAAALLIVVILAAAGLIVASSVLFSGLGELDMGYTYQCGEEAFALADGCVEESFRRLQINSSYNGGALAIDDGNCIIGVVSSGQNKTITATSTVSNCSKTIETNVDIIDNIITVNSWQEK